MIKSKITKRLMIALAVAVVGLTSIGVVTTAKSEIGERNEVIEVLKQDLHKEQNGSKKKDEVIKEIEQEKTDSERTNKNTIDKLNKSLKEEKKRIEDLSTKLDEALAAKVEREAKKALSDTPQPNGNSEQVAAAKAPESTSVESTDVSTPNGGRQITVQATAYDGVSLGGLTASGYQIQGTGDKVIAVDPSVIPMGSTVYVPGYGTAIARDTGGAINGNIIDLNMATHDAIQWGRRTVTITVY